MRVPSLQKAIWPPVQFKFDGKQIKDESSHQFCLWQHGSHITGSESVGFKLTTRTKLISHPVPSHVTATSPEAKDDTHLTFL